MAKRTLVVEIICLILAALFFYTAINKVTHYTTFIAQFEQSSLLRPISKFVAPLVPIFEIIVALLVFVPRTRLTGLYLSAGLLISFTAYIVALLLFAPDLPCSCGGVLQSMTWTEHILFNCLFITLSIVAIRLQHMSKKLKHSPLQPQL